MFGTNALRVSAHGLSPGLFRGRFSSARIKLPDSEGVTVVYSSAPGGAFLASSSPAGILILRQRGCSEHVTGARDCPVYQPQEMVRPGACKGHGPYGGYRHERRRALTASSVAKYISKPWPSPGHPEVMKRVTSSSVFPYSLLSTPYSLERSDSHRAVNSPPILTLAVPGRQAWGDAARVFLRERKAEEIR